eukprot:Gregarina_sp_Pseudo_9__1472@NODE_1995_length_1215_cov_115_245748_g1843_i0_p1_GENE_NODE_1995_length_1215_cov_115_245748_g1843_i0NODE_1995_length_1215_cov_115_245748_g1843_i0_p1_ORF_typecomplete_len209_score27_95Epiglycanin_C/PF14654_6/0_00096_NODE_1995_length_1215_cov_115_245748_g1843_i0331957
MCPPVKRKNGHFWDNGISSPQSPICNGHSGARHKVPRKKKRASHFIDNKLSIFATMWSVFILAITAVASLNVDTTPAATSALSTVEDSPIWDEIVHGLRNVVGWADDKEIELLASSTCSKYNNKCSKCADQDVCSYCYATAMCTENTYTANQVCNHEKGWIGSKRKCDGYLTWWAILLITLACVCLCPLISFLCFVYIIKKICCGGGD